MRILVLTNLYPNPFDPNRGLFNRHQIVCLALHHDVRVISPILWTDELSARREGKPKLSGDRQTQLDGISIIHPRYFYTPKVLRGCYGRFMKASVKRPFNRLVDQFSPDIVFAPWAYPDGWAAVKLGHRRGLPVVVKVHGSDIHRLSDHQAREAGTLAGLSACDAVIAVSHDLKQRLVGLGIDEEKISVVYNGTDSTVFFPGDRQEARQRLGLTSKDTIVLTVGSFVPVKGHSVLLDAIADLKASDEHVDCHLIGDGPLRGSLEFKAAKLGLADRVKFAGNKSQIELGDWYRAADVVVLPSLAEGIPNVLLEAMACGVRFVASRVGGIPELPLSERHGRLVPAGDVPALASAIRAVLKEDHRSVPSAPRTHLQAANELTDLFTEVCAQRGSRRLDAVAGATSRVNFIP